MSNQKLYKAVWGKRVTHAGETAPPENIHFSLMGDNMLIERNQIYEKSGSTDLDATPYPKLSEEVINHPALSGVFSEVKTKKKTKK